MGISTGLDIAMRALMAQQSAVDTASHNVANATTPGYSRQRVRLAAQPGASAYGGGVSGPGGGVAVLSTQRVRDLFTDFQWRSANQDLGKFEAASTSLSQVELVLNEPGDSGLRAVLSRFFSSWGDLTNQPESSAARTAVVQAGDSLAITVTRIRDSFTRLQSEADARISSYVHEINGLSQKIAGLNERIVRLQVSGNEASDLRDTRDMAMDQLSGLVDAQFMERDDGRIDITVGGHSLVQGTQTFEIAGTPDAANNNYLDLTFVSDGAAANIKSGAIGGLLNQRDVYLPARAADLDSLVGQLIVDVNAAHAAGYGLDSVTGRDFFSGTDASNITVSAAVSADPNTIAASRTVAGVPGDAIQSAAISDLQYAKNLLTGTATYDSFWASFVSGVGTASAESTLLDQAQGAVVQQIDQLRQATSGVNLDEELVTLTGYQRAYEASARLVSILDQMLDTLINKMV